MKKFTKEQGITLIALIITIIVMLILVAVTINVALNGGLFTRAKEATFKTEIQQIQEQILLKKAEQMADNEINGTTGYNITLDNLDISTELKNKYRNKLSVSSDGELQYDEDNCTAEEKTYLASIGAKSGTAPVETKLEFDLKNSVFGDEYDDCTVAKSILDDGNFYFYIEFIDGGETHKGNVFSGTYTFTTDTEDYKEGTLVVTKMYDFDEDVEEDVPPSYQEEIPIMVLAVKENGQTVNTIFIGAGSGVGSGTSNGTVGLDVPDSDLIGTYTNEDDETVLLGVSQDQTKGILTIVGQTNVTYDMYIVNTGNKEYIYMQYGLFEITRDTQNETITIEAMDEIYTKVNS